MENQDIAEIFHQIATILELKGDNPFRIRAYQRAAQIIEGLSENLKNLVEKDTLEDIPGIGKDIAKKIKEIVNTNKLKFYQELKKTIPSGLIEMLSIPSLGPKTVKLIYDKLKITNIKALEKAARQGKLEKLPGVKKKTEENIIKGIELIKHGREHMPLYLALEVAKKFTEPLKKLKEVERIEVAGSVRRKKDTVKDIDILVISSKSSKVMDTFVNSPYVKQVIVHGPTKSSILSRQNIQVDLRVVKKDSFGAALMYFTGSKNFNITLRQYAVRKNYKINEYGVFKVGKPEKKVAGKTEEQIFDLFKIEYVPATLREDRGEFDLALKHRLPKIIQPSMIKGDLHVHSKYSDGAHSLDELAKAGMEKKYQYLAICDHSQSLHVAGGLGKKEVFQKIDQIKKINKKYSNFKLLAGTEVDILSDGSLDYPDEVLKELDVVIAAVHTGFKQHKKQLTSRIVKAAKNKYVHIIAHPTSRLFGVRNPYVVDFDEIFSICGDYNVAMEVNAYYQRLDLDDILCKKAKEMGVKLSIGTDAHKLMHLDFMDLGVWVCQRGWLEAKDVLNTFDLASLLQWLKKKN